MIMSVAGFMRGRGSESNLTMWMFLGKKVFGPIRTSELLLQRISRF